jgi:hypothetical protein
MKQLSYFVLLAGAVLPLTLSAQIVDDYNPPRAACCLLGTAQNLVNSMQDWNALGRYHLNYARKHDPAPVCVRMP